MDYAISHGAEAEQTQQQYCRRSSGLTAGVSSRIDLYRTAVEVRHSCMSADVRTFRKLANLAVGEPEVAGVVVAAAVAAGFQSDTREVWEVEEAGRMD